jgi:NhaA family Na+:H+ antiporter
MSTNKLKEFLKLESSAGITLMLATAAALIVSNSPLTSYYTQFLDTRVAVIFGALVLDKPLLLWINDGLMAVFFLLIGLELKREIMEGELSNKEQLVLPLLAAVGGFAVPAFIYILFNQGNPEALNGWAIPSATDIAFALGVLALLGSRAPLALKIFLTTLAIIDDLAAIIVIAIFYSSDLSVASLTFAAIGIAVLVGLNLRGITNKAPYVIVGIIVWVCVLKSGVHATLAGVILAFTIPMRGKAQPGSTLPIPSNLISPLKEMEHSLHPWVAFAVLPIFAFANAGVNLSGFTWSDLQNTVTMGIFFGLVVGKTIGVFGISWISVKAGWVSLPAGVNWQQMLGVSVLTGIGFTMSLFIATLAFEHGPFDYLQATRVGVLAASVLSALVGAALILTSASPKTLVNDKLVKID